MFHRLLGASALAVACACLPTARASAADSCGQSAGFKLCLTTPAGSLAGDQTISATWLGSGSPTIEFTLNGNYLNFEYQKPFSFTWPTAKERDGTYTLAARVHIGTTYGTYVSTSVTLRNGNTSGVPTSASNYESLFSPQAGGTIAAVGNGGAEKPAEKTLLNYIASTKP